MAFFSILLAIIYANFLEWFVHKYVLHGIGKRKGSYWSDHYSVHHLNYHLHAGKDPDYTDYKLTSEIIGLAGMSVLHIPVCLLSPAAYVTLVIYAIFYYFVHRYSHVNPTWGKKWIPWHIEHHRGKEMNWCVLFPLADHVMRTRYVSK